VLHFPAHVTLVSSSRSDQVDRRPVLLGAAYAALDRLERNGLVTSAVGSATPARGGRARRFFKVTPRGLRAVRNTQQALVAMWRGIPQLRARRASLRFKPVNLTASPVNGVGGLAVAALALLMTLVMPAAWWLLLGSSAAGIVLGGVMIARQRMRA